MQDIHIITLINTNNVNLPDAFGKEMKFLQHWELVREQESTFCQQTEPWPADGICVRTSHYLFSGIGLFLSPSFYTKISQDAAGSSGSNIGIGLNIDLFLFLFQDAFQMGK